MEKWKKMQCFPATHAQRWKKKTRYFVFQKERCGGLGWTTPPNIGRGVPDTLTPPAGGGTPTCLNTEGLPICWDLAGQRRKGWARTRPRKGGRGRGQPRRRCAARCPPSTPYPTDPEGQRGVGGAKEPGWHLQNKANLFFSAINANLSLAPGLMRLQKRENNGTVHVHSPTPRSWPDKCSR